MLMIMMMIVLMMIVLFALAKNDGPKTGASFWTKFGLQSGTAPNSIFKTTVQTIVFGVTFWTRF
jgi:hypothetical protein